MNAPQLQCAARQSRCVCLVHGQQYLGGGALVHRLVALSCLVNGQNQVEDAAGLNFALVNQFDEGRQVLAHGGGATLK